MLHFSHAVVLVLISDMEERHMQGDSRFSGLGERCPSSKLEPGVLSLWVLSKVFNGGVAWNGIERGFAPLTGSIKARQQGPGQVHNTVKVSRAFTFIPVKFPTLNADCDPSQVFKSEPPVKQWWKVTARDTVALNKKVQFV